MYYAATGLAGEVEGVETGCGGPEPFQIAATKWTSAPQFAAYLRSLKLPGVTFSEYAKGGFGGVRMHIEPDSTANLSALGIYLLTVAQQNAPHSIFKGPAKKYDIFYKCYGSDSIRSAIEKRTPASKIIGSWATNNARFLNERRSFLLY